MARSTREQRSSPLSRGARERRVFEPGSWLLEQPNSDSQFVKFIADGELDQYECSRTAWKRAQKRQPETLQNRDSRESPMT